MRSNSKTLNLGSDGVSRESNLRFKNRPSHVGGDGMEKTIKSLVGRDESERGV